MGSQKVGELVGMNVKAARERRGMTQGQLGLALEAFLGKTWTRQAVSIAESGDRAFAAEDLLALAGATGTTVEDLLLPTDPSALRDGVVALPAVDLSYEGLLDIVIGLTEDENVEAQAEAGSSLLREKVTRLREAHELLAQAVELSDKRLKLIEEMATQGWYLAKRRQS